MFEGFSERTIDFLWGVRFNNNREWIAEHKEEYRSDLLAPMRELAGEVQARMAEQYPDEHFCTHVSKIYRDARRLHGNPPLKEELWFSLFSGAERDTQRPEYYFSVFPEGYSFGLGAWSATPADMAKFRRDCQQRPERMTALVRDFQKQEIFSVCGRDYAKSKGEVAEILRPWFQKRSIYFDCTRPYDDTVFSHAMVRELAEGFAVLFPVYRYFAALVGREEAT